MIAAGTPSVLVALVASSALVALAVRWLLPPHLAARALSVVIGGALVVTLSVVGLLAAAYLVHVPVFGDAFQWCSMRVGIHGAIAWWLGLPAVAVMVIGAVRVARVLRDHRRYRCRDAGAVQVVDDPVPYALTLPGRGGQVVVSRGLLEALDDDETRVVLAHEHAHAHLRHDRYLLLASVSCALVPPLAVVARPLRFAVERWADEVAARRCGDRRLVAATLGRVALFSHATPAAAGIGGAAISGRVAALLDPPRRRPNRGLLLALWAVVAVMSVAAVHLVQHLGPLFGALCHH